MAFGLVGDICVENFESYALEWTYDGLHRWTPLIASLLPRPPPQSYRGDLPSAAVRSFNVCRGRRVIHATKAVAVDGAPGEMSGGGRGAYTNLVLPDQVKRRPSTRA